METTSADAAAVRFPPPLVYLLAVLAGGLLKAFVAPLPFLLPTPLRIGVATICVLVGAAMMGGAIGVFRRTGQDPTPWKPTPEIVSSGIFRFTRNPMYVGMALIQAGIGIGWANGWVLLLLPVSLFAVYRIAIRHEEAYLERKFGETYLQYKRSVRRWL